MTKWNFGEKEKRVYALIKSYEKTIAACIMHWLSPMRKQHVYAPMKSYTKTTACVCTDEVLYKDNSTCMHQWSPIQRQLHVYAPMKSYTKTTACVCTDAKPTPMHKHKPSWRWSTELSVGSGGVLLQFLVVEAYFLGPECARLHGVYERSPQTCLLQLVEGVCGGAPWWTHLVLQLFRVTFGVQHHLGGSLKYRDTGRMLLGYREQRILLSYRDHVARLQGQGGCC